MLLAFSNHKCLDDISQTFLKISSKIDTQRYGEALEQIRLAKLHIVDILTNEIPSFENIFLVDFLNFCVILNVIPS
ncbi:MAG: DUF4363 family protein [Clostridiales bacterium]|nr:MAG: DUF4363 family protein [Clostridiales bacterium]